MPKSIRPADAPPHAGEGDDDDAEGGSDVRHKLGPSPIGKADSLEEFDEPAGIPDCSPPSHTATEEIPRSTIIFGIALYAACSSTLLVINKVSMHLVPDASFVLFCQFAASSLSVRALKYAQPDMDIELLEFGKAKAFFLATLVFHLCLFSNTEALTSVNVETVIVVRSCSPLAVALLDHYSLGKDLPSPQGFAALLTIAGGAALYVATDAGFHVTGYAWLMAYFVFIVIEMVFVKFVVDTVPMSTWTRVYYNNTLSLPLAVLSAIVVGETHLGDVQWTFDAMFAVALSCVVGVAISYAGFNLRKLISATSFTVVGVVCKIITVLINDMIWTKHANAMGHVGLLICIVAGFAYEKVKARK